MAKLLCVSILHFFIAPSISSALDLASHSLQSFDQVQVCGSAHYSYFIAALKLTSSLFIEVSFLYALRPLTNTPQCVLHLVFAIVLFRFANFAADVEAGVVGEGSAGGMVLLKKYERFKMRVVVADQTK